MKLKTILTCTALLVGGCAQTAALSIEQQMTVEYRKQAATARMALEAERAAHRKIIARLTLKNRKLQQNRDYLDRDTRMLLNNLEKCVEIANSNGVDIGWDRFQR